MRQRTRPLFSDVQLPEALNGLTFGCRIPIPASLCLPGEQS